MGKTRLARQVMREVSHGNEAAARFCSLATCRSAADFEAAVAQSLGVPLVAGAQLVRALADRGPSLLVLDNLESVMEHARPSVAAWLDHGTELQILVTSLLPTGLEGECVFDLGPLDRDDAVGLYLERASRAWRSRTFSDRERPVLEELDGRLDRIPLAIELAAARVRVLPPRVLLSRISERFELLQTRRPGRHQSLVEALTLTWELLTPEEKRVLEQASVFEGGFDLEGAEAVMGASGDLGTLDALDELRSRALLQVGDEEEPPRFSLYDSVREFAARALERSGERAEVVRRHALHYVALGEKYAAEGNGSDAPRAMRWLAAERENLTAAHRHVREEDPLLAARAGLVLSPVMELHGPPTSEAELLDSTVECARRSGDPALFVRALRARASARKRHGRPDDALEDIATGLETARRIGDRVAEGLLLVESGSVRTRTADLDAAFADLEAAATIARETGDPLLRGFAASRRGAAEEARASLAEGARSFEEAIAIFRQHGDLRSLGLALLGLGLVRSGQGRLREARQANEEARSVFRRLDHRVFEVGAIVNLGSVELTAGQLDEAESYCVQAIALERELGYRLFEALSIGNLGIVSLERGDTRMAEARLLEALSICREIGEGRYHHLFLVFLSVVEAMLGRIDEAKRSLATARASLGELGDRGSLAVTHVLEGLVELAEARSLVQAGRAAEAEALEESAAARLAPRSDAQAESLILARRLLERALARKGVPVAGEPRAAATEGLTMGPAGEWFELDGKRVDMRKRSAIRRMLVGLVEQQLVAPGIGLSQQEIFAIGWPGERILPEAAATRVYTAVRTLRSLGLGAVLLRNGDGYLLDPQLRINRA